MLIIPFLWTFVAALDEMVSISNNTSPEVIYSEPPERAAPPDTTGMIEAPFHDLPSYIVKQTELLPPSIETTVAPETAEPAEPVEPVVEITRNASSTTETITSQTVNKKTTETVIDTTIANSNSSTTVFRSSASLLDKTVMYIAGGALVLYSVLSN